MVCKSCESSPVYRLENGQRLCRKCFISYFEDKVFKTFRKFSLLDHGDTVICAVSGGKDSTTALNLTYKFMARRNLQHNLKALAVDEGIEGYRAPTIEFMREFCNQRGIELEVVSFKELYGKYQDENVEFLRSNNSNISPCNICGTFRRNALNRKAREMKADKVVTGHNLDDEAQNIMLNIFKNNFKILARLGPGNGVVSSNSFVPRVKPLYFCSEKEVRLYTLLKGFDVGYDECPYARGSFRENISDMLNRLEEQHKGVKHSVVNFYLNIRDSLQEDYISSYGEEVTYCQICGEPSQKEVCNACEFRKALGTL